MHGLMALALASNFGSVEGWFESVVALVQAHRAAGGELRLTFDPATETLFNRWAAPGESSSALVTLLAIPLPAPADDLRSRVDRTRVHALYQEAVEQASECFGARDVAGALLLNARRAGVFANAHTMLPDAAWHDPVAVQAWGRRVPLDRPVVVYCVLGHEICRVTAVRLQALGVNARFLEGGIAAFEKAPAMRRC